MAHRHSSSGVPVTGYLRVSRLGAEYRDGLGLGTPVPRLSWITETDTPGWTQASYEIDVDGVTTTVDSGASVLVPWPAEPLTSRQRAAVRVRVTGADGRRSAWSDELIVEAGLLDLADWSARFVSPDVPLEATAYVRTEFTVPADVQLARLYVTSLGVHDLELNGRPASDRVLAPGWTSYHHRLRYETLDVTALLTPGTNALGAVLADGWYRGRIGAGPAAMSTALYGDRLALLAQLEVTTADGVVHRIVTDESWRWFRGATTRASLYDGEDHDARLQPDGWSTAGFDAAGWLSVDVIDRDLDTLVSALGPPVRRIEELAPISIATAPSGRTIVDFGQNVSGRLRVTVAGETGDAVTLRHAEILEEGELCTEPLRSAQATDRYLLQGGGRESWEPSFTFHGFRYAELEGRAVERCAEDVRAVVCHSDLRRTGWFECSDDRINRLHDNVVWSMRDNFLDIPTDCPQRDERLGWTGDITVFAPTACFLYDVGGFLSSWLADLAAEQSDTQGVPFVVPNVMGDLWIGTAIWGDAAVAVPWTLYQRYGDLEILRRQFTSMCNWIDWVIRSAGDDRHWESPFQFGDWLDPAAPPDDPSAARTDRHLVANAWFCRSLYVMSQVAALLSDDKAAERYGAVAREARATFVDRYVASDGRMVSDAQTAYALALCFDLLDPDQRRAAGRRLVELVRAEGHRIGTGFAGTPLICDALCAAGEPDDAYELLFQTESPSWLYPVLHGATTIWERWDGIRPDGSRNPGEMNSFNHYALGAVADWLHRTVAGLAPAEPGYRRILVQPKPTERLEHAMACHDTPYGRAEAGWRRQGTSFVVTATIPPNTSATIVLPDGQPAFDVGAGSHRWTVDSTTAP